MYAGYMAPWARVRGRVRGRARVRGRVKVRFANGWTQFWTSMVRVRVRPGEGCDNAPFGDRARGVPWAISYPGSYTAIRGGGCIAHHQRYLEGRTLPLGRRSVRVRVRVRTIF